MTLSRNEIAAARAVYETYWQSYFTGNIEAFAATIDEAFSIIGTSEGETSFGKEAVVAMYEAQFEEIVGKAEVRNRQVREIPTGDLLQIIEFSDIYVLVDSDWTFYSKFRLSTLLHQTPNGWKLLQQHGSLPDMRVGEGETVAVEKVSKENLELRDAIKRRTVELEAKNRELEIEAALEKVRSRTMAMQHSDELAEASFLLDEQVRGLGMKTWGCAFNIFEENHSTEWFGNEAGVLNTYTVPREGVFKEYYQKHLEGETFYVKEFAGQNCIDHYEFMSGLPVIGDVLLKLKETNDGFPTFQIDHVAYFKYGYVLFITREQVPEWHQVFKRFAKVFEQTYTRFLDLQKAEAQAREAQVEAALEKVRSRSLAMHQSNELKAVIKVVYEQLLHLNIKLDHAGFVVDYSPLGDWHFWIADDREIPSKITHPYFESVWANQFNEAKKNGETHFVTHLNFEEKNKFYNELLSHVSGLSETSKEFYLSCPGLAATTVLFDDVSLYIENFSEIPYKEEENQIVMRFGKIFQQAYTRFLDLQKAEAQAREAKIETALEKVRSRTMGMQKSEELADVAFVLFEQLRTLGGNLWGTGFGLCEKGSDGDSFWFANENGVFPPVSIPNTTDPAHQQMHKGWKAGKDYLAIEASGKELESHYNYMLSLTEVKPFFQKILDEGLSFPKWQQWNAAYFKQGYLLIITLEPYPDPEILKRFANVFDQTYTRFLDLQKAEAQAREAKIEAALEKVRARTMGMQKSDELAEVAVELFEQISLLTSIPSRFNVAIVNENDRVFDVWLTDVKGHILKELFVMDVEKSEVIAELFNAWKNKKKYLIQHLTGKHLDKWVKYANEDVGVPFDKSAIQEDRYINSILFKQGFIGITTDQIPDDSVLEILERFTHVFEQTYTRFLDLQKSEEQAQEAQLELSLERIRAQVTGMQESSDLLDIVVTMRTEFVNLGHDAHYFWHMRWLPDVYKKAMTSGDGTKIGMVMTLPRHIHGDIQEVAAWEKTKDPIHVLAMDVDVAVDYVDKMISLGDFERVDPQAPTLDDIRHIGGLTFVMARTTHGEIGFSLPGVVPDPPKDAVDTLTRFAGVFDLAYRRFEDLKNAELQMRENRIELSLERIRGQVTAMQESSDLFDIVVGMRKEFISLGHESDYFWHMRWLPDVYEMSMTSEDGNRLGMVIQVPKAVHDQIEALAEWETSDDPIFVLPLDAKDAWDYLENMNTYGHYEKADPNAPAQEDIEHIGGLTFIIARTTHGEIGYSLPGMVPNPPKEALNTLMRFASVFDLAYKRFEDLKTAEKDLIEIKRARQKAEDALTELKATQSQLVQQEKLASLGQLTAGIAHEIKNPLNFVNNFSEVSVELVDEALEEIEKLEDSDVKEEIIEILNDVKGNLTKVHSHGSRADSIVKSMLQHSRGGSGKMEPTDLNALIKEYVNLAFHGMRAGKNPINVDIQMDLDDKIGQVNLIGEDFSRVILNLCNNAFDAMREKAKVREDYLPVLSVKTRLTANDQQIIAVSDNGPGIPDDLKDKIMQPFFTTKKGTEGTGLGLSITNDIIKAHGGELSVRSELGKGLPAGQTGTTFTIHLKDQNV